MLFFSLFSFFGGTKYYTSQIILLPEYHTQSTRGANLFSGLGALSGLMQGVGIQTYRGSSDAVRIELYPEILSSTPLLHELLMEEYYFSRYNIHATLYDYLNHIKKPSVADYVISYSIGLPFTLLAYFRSMIASDHSDVTAKAITDNSGAFLVLSRDQMRTIESVRESIDARISPELKTLDVLVTFDDPVVAALIANSLVEKLSSYVSDYRTQKTRDDLAFLLARKQEARDRFVESQENLARFRDQNRNVQSAKIQFEGENLRMEYNMAYELVAILTGQSKELQLKLQEEMPLFKILEPAEVPVFFSSPSLTRSLFMSIFFALLITIFVIMWNQKKYFILEAMRQK